MGPGSGLRVAYSWMAWPVLNNLFSTLGGVQGSKPYKFIGFGDLHGPKPYEFIGFGDLHGPKPYEFIGFGSVD